MDNKTPKTVRKRNWLGNINKDYPESSIHLSYQHSFIHGTKKSDGIYANLTIRGCGHRHVELDLDCYDENDRDENVSRLEIIRDYCDILIEQLNKSKFKRKKE